MLLCEQTTRRALGKKQAFQEEESYQTLVQHQLTPTVVSKQRVQAAIALRPVAQLQKSGPGLENEDVLEKRLKPLERKLGVF